ncbi:MAG: hypothetical protein ACTSRW_02580 [Candidatus Helarchaeota archaeon]
MDLKDEFIKRLIEWFEKNKREFSWRKPGLIPFHSLIAELMLQKTGANQVEKIFPDFIKKYPTPSKIVETDLEKLERELEPLGLQNRRARDLKKLSETILELNGEVPSTFEGLIALPGIGEYMANAILCFAFNQDVPIVDANVARIMKRVFSLKVKDAPTRDKRLWEYVSFLIVPGQAKKINYALLDFGALVCIARKPKCQGCCMLKICHHGKKHVNKLIDAKKE